MVEFCEILYIFTHELRRLSIFPSGMDGAKWCGIEFDKKVEKST